MTALLEEEESLSYVSYDRSRQKVAATVLLCAEQSCSEIPFCVLCHTEAGNVAKAGKTNKSGMLLKFKQTKTFILYLDTIYQYCTQYSSDMACSPLQHQDCTSFLSEK